MKKAVAEGTFFMKSPVLKGCGISQIHAALDNNKKQKFFFNNLIYSTSVDVLKFQIFLPLSFYLLFCSYYCQLCSSDILLLQMSALLLLQSPLCSSSSPPCFSYGYSTRKQKIELYFGFINLSKLHTVNCICKSDSKTAKPTINSI